MEVPDLAQGQFETLTITGQLNVATRTLSGQPAILIGSSLGGYIASLYAARHPEVRCLILLAPAFDFHNLWISEMNPAELAQWKQNGTLSVFHYGAGRNLPVSYGLLEDAAKYEPFPDVRQPVLIFHGTRDKSVPLEYSIRFQSKHPNACLVQAESGHELTDVLDLIWDECKKFLSDPQRVNRVID